MLQALSAVTPEIQSLKSLDVMGSYVRDVYAARHHKGRPWTQEQPQIHYQVTAMMKLCVRLLEFGPKTVAALRHGHEAAAQFAQ